MIESVSFRASKFYRHNSQILGKKKGTFYQNHKLKFDLLV